MKYLIFISIAFILVGCQEESLSLASGDCVRSTADEMIYQVSKVQDDHYLCRVGVDFQTEVKMKKTHFKKSMYRQVSCP